jgi:hypothetical protein
MESHLTPRQTGSIWKRPKKTANWQDDIKREMPLTDGGIPDILNSIVQQIYLF